MPAIDLPAATGAFIAFASAFFTIYLDSYFIFRKSTLIVPKTFWTSLRLFSFSALGSLVAVAAFLYSETTDPGWLDTILGGTIKNPYIKGLYTGFAVIAIFRSKLLQFRGSDVGVEYIYNELRLISIINISVDWQSWTSGFIDNNMPVALAIQGFDNRCRDLIVAAVENAEADLKTSLQSQLTALLTSKPAAAAGDQAALIVYYRAFISLVLATCGTKPLCAMGFKK